MPPRLPVFCLPREALVRRLREGFGERLTAVVAGAGYGKSTLLAQSLQDVDVPWVWLSCDERIAGSRELLAHVAAGLSTRFPGFGARLLFEGGVGDQVAELCNELVELVSDDFLLALDDVHALGDSTAAEALALMVRDLPTEAHLALASRAAPPFRLGRLRAGRAALLGETELALSEEESAALIQLTRPDLASQAAQDVHQRTEGWIAGTLLAIRSSRPAAGETILASDDHFDYLAEEVLAGLEPEVKEFLLDTSVLDRFTPAIAGAVAQHAQPERLIAALSARHLFLIRLTGDGDWYRYHHLFAAFLRRQLDSQRDRLREVHRRAGTTWQAAGEPVEGARHHLEAGDHEAAIAALEPVAEGLVVSPQADALARILERLPRQAWADRPGLVLAHASLLYGTGAFEQGFTALQQAIDLLLSLGEQQRAAVAFFRLIQTMTSVGFVERTFPLVERYLPLLDPAGAVLPMGRMMIAFAYGWAGRHEEAEEELRSAEAAPAASRFPLMDLYVAATRAYVVDHFQGRGELGRQDLEAAIRGIEARQSEDSVGYLVWARMYLMFLLGHLGYPEEALRAVEPAREAARRTGFGRAVERLTPFGVLGSLVALGRWHEVEQELAQGVRLAAALRGGVYAARYHATIAQRALADGDLETAMAHVPLARGDTSFLHALVLTDLARSLAEAGLLEEAHEAALEAGRMAAEMRAPWAAAEAALIAAYASGPGPSGDALLVEALQATGDHGYEGLWTRRNRSLATRLLARALAADLGPAGLAARIAAACGAETIAECVSLLEDAPASARAQLAEVVGDVPGVDERVVARLDRDRHPSVRAAAKRAGVRLAARPRPPFYLQGLGGFAVYRDGIMVPSNAFGREKARTLLAALLCARIPVHRERLLEWFWPELPPERAVRAFHVTLFELRRALEPASGRRAVSSLVVAEGESYRVVLREQDRFDADHFLAFVRTGLSASSGPGRVRLLQEAEGAYGGELFPEWPYAPWAEGMRAEVERAHRSTLEALAQEFIRAGDHSAGAIRYERLVALEPERERWHRGLMRAYAAAGERAVALRQYHACRAILRRELGVEPSEKTRALYVELLA